jgi:hypothetical protein
MNYLPNLIVPAPFAGTGHCPIAGCPHRISRRRLMCFRHWLTVPVWSRTKVWHLLKEEYGTSWFVAAVTQAFRLAHQGPPPSYLALLRTCFRH